MDVVPFLLQGNVERAIEAWTSKSTWQDFKSRVRESADIMEIFARLACAVFHREILNGEKMQCGDFLFHQKTFACFKFATKCKTSTLPPIQLFIECLKNFDDLWMRLDARWKDITCRKMIAVEPFIAEVWSLNVEPAACSLSTPQKQESLEISFNTSGSIKETEHVSVQSNAGDHVAVLRYDSSAHNQFDDDEDEFSPSTVKEEPLDVEEEFFAGDVKDGSSNERRPVKRRLVSYNIAEPPTAVAKTAEAAATCSPLFEDRKGVKDEPDDEPCSSQTVRRPIRIAVRVIPANRPTTSAQTLPPVKRPRAEFESTSQTISDDITNARSSAVANYQCTYEHCRVMCPTFDDLMSHLRTHLGGGAHLCDWPGCGKSFAKLVDYQVHELIHNAGRFKCTTEGCHELFETLDELRDHELQHPKKRRKSTSKKKEPLMCPEPGCGRSFPYPSTLSNHQKTHVKRKYKCPVKKCNKSYDDFSHLEAHVVWHTPEQMAGINILSLANGTSSTGQNDSVINHDDDSMEIKKR